MEPVRGLSCKLARKGAEGGWGPAPSVVARPPACPASDAYRLVSSATDGMGLVALRPPASGRSTRHDVCPRLWACSTTLPTCWPPPPPSRPPAPAYGAVGAAVSKSKEAADEAEEKRREAMPQVGVRTAAGCWAPLLGWTGMLSPGRSVQGWWERRPGICGVVPPACFA